MNTATSNAEEILKKEVLRIADLQELTGLSQPTVVELMKQIRYVSDTLRIRGVIHRQDYEAYLAYKREEAAQRIEKRR